MSLRHLMGMAGDILTYPIRDAIHDYQTFRRGWNDHVPDAPFRAVTNAGIIQTAKYIPTICSVVMDSYLPSDIQVALAVFVADNVKTGLTTSKRWHTSLFTDGEGERQALRPKCRVCGELPCAAAETCG